jgi:hypothetical protein
MGLYRVNISKGKKDISHPHLEDGQMRSEGTGRKLLEVKEQPLFPNFSNLLEDNRRGILDKHFLG